jgi:hypothetical protein
MWGPRRLRSVIAAICAVVLGVGLLTSTSGATPGPPGSASQASTAGRHPIAPPTASNRRAAVIDAKRLLADATPPAGASPQSSGTGSGPHAHLLTSVFASAIAYRSWTISEDPASVLSDVIAHLPAGATMQSTGSSSPNPVSQFAIYSRPSINGVLDVRWLEIEVTARAAGGTLLYAESQSQWVVTRSPREHIPSGAREVDVTSAVPGRQPFVSRRVLSRAKVGALVALFNSLARA